MPHRAKDRALLAQTLIDLIKVLRKRLGRKHSIETLVVSAAVIAGHAAGRPRGATEIARAVDLPRATVTRKLGELVRDGLIERQGGKYLMIAHPASHSYIDEALEVIRRARPP